MGENETPLKPSQESHHILPNITHNAAIVRLSPPNPAPR